MQREQLIDHLNTISKISNQEWLDSLNDRKQKELDFHNRDRDRQLIKEMDQDTFDKFYSNKKFYSTVGRSQLYYENWVSNNSKDKIFLDYACGNGGFALMAAKAGADLSIGFDISDVSVRNAQLAAKENDLDNTFFFQADAENTKLPDDSVDIVLCSGMLHHVDLSYAFPELRRILAPGGKILAIEALAYNPLIKLYREMTPQMRTEWEKSHILSMKDVEFAGRFFNIGEIKFWHITSYAGAYLKKLLPLFDAIDDILTAIPGIRRLAWIFSFELLSKE